MTGLAQLGYSRETERRADTTALAAIVARYGHTGGAAQVFRVLVQAAPAERGRVPAFLSTHPADEARIAALAAAAAGWDPEREPLRPLPPMAPD